MNAPCKTIGLGPRSPALARRGFVFCLILLLVQTLPAAVLTHRYPFDTNAADVVGGADGILQGNAFVTNGAVVFDGVNSGVQLPTNLFTNYDSITFEVWFVDLGNSAFRSPLYEFSGSGGLINYLDVSAALTGVGSCQVGSVIQSVSIPMSTPVITNHVVWTQDSNSHSAFVYLNGIQLGQNTSFTNAPAQVGPTGANWLGRSPMNSLVFLGSIQEFRVYQGALSALEVAQLDAAGPEQPLISPGSLQDVRVVLPATFGPGALLQRAIFADYANLTNVNIIGQPELVLLSDNTNVLQVTGQQKIRTLGLGTAGITAAYLGFSNVTTVTVAIPQDYTLSHRYGFGESNRDWVVHDSVGSAHGRLIGGGGPGGVSGFTGKGELSLNSGFVALPQSILSCLSEVTFEVWVTYSGASGGILGPSWPRIFDFGNWTNATGIMMEPATFGDTYFFLTPSADTFTTQPVMRAAISTNWIPAESPRLDWTNTLPMNVASHLAVTYSPARGIAKLYLNGTPVASGSATIPLGLLMDINNWLGKSQYSEDPAFVGRYNEFRIYSGFLQDSDIAADYAAGPNVIGTDYLLHSFVSTTNLVLSWGQAMANWILQSSPTVDSNALWMPVNTTTNFQNNRYSVSLPMSDNSAFFRLQQGP